MEARPLALGDVVHPRERLLFAVMVLVSLLIYGGLGLLAFSDAAIGSVVLFYGVLLAVGA